MRVPSFRRCVALISAALLLTACAHGRSSSASGEIGSDEWRLVEVAGRPAAPDDDMSRRPSLRFAPDSGRVSGNAGCNQFAGPFTRNGSSITFGALMSTRMACVDNAMNRQEQDYLAALQATDHFEISGNTLTLFRSSQRLARLVRR